MVETSITNHFEIEPCESRRSNCNAYASASRVRKCWFLSYSEAGFRNSWCRGLSDRAVDRGTLRRAMRTLRRPLRVLDCSMPSRALHRSRNRSAFSADSISHVVPFQYTESSSLPFARGRALEERNCIVALQGDGGLRTRKTRDREQQDQNCNGNAETAANTVSSFALKVCNQSCTSCAMARAEDIEAGDAAATERRRSCS